VFISRNPPQGQVKKESSYGWESNAKLAKLAGANKKKKGDNFEIPFLSALTASPRRTRDLL
jgi:hypothetical protein